MTHRALVIVASTRAAAGEYSTPKGDLTVTAPVVFGPP